MGKILTFLCLLHLFECIYTFIFLWLSISFFLSNQIKCLTSLPNVHSCFFFFKLILSSFPPPASIFPSFQQAHLSSLLHLQSSLIRWPISSTLLSSPPLYYSYSQMSDLSLVFLLPSHHIFHTAPSLNRTCIIISCRIPDHSER